MAIVTMVVGALPHPEHQADDSESTSTYDDDSQVTTTVVQTRESHYLFTIED